MGARGRSVNRPHSCHDQRRDGIRRLMHDVHDSAEALVVHRNAGKRVGSTAPTFRMQKDGIGFVTGPRFAHGLPRSGDGGSLRRPIFATVALGLQRVVPGGNTARFSDEPVFIRAEPSEISLFPVNIHCSR